MSSYSGPNENTLGLVLDLDVINKKSYITAGNQSLINTDGWANGQTSSIGIYGANQTVATENIRVNATDPWGNSNVIWETRASGDSGADGGWNTNYVNIDKTKTYRLSVWVKRISSTTSGTFYLGTNSNGGVFSTQDSTQKGNPYWECSNVGILTQDQWYLVCGHIYPHNTIYTGNNLDSGYYTIESGYKKVKSLNYCNIVSDLKWGTGSTNVQHRCYHYYCGDATTRLQFTDPRIDCIETGAPTIPDLLKRGFKTLGDNILSYTNASINGSPVYTPNSDIYFDGTGSQFINVYRADVNGGSWAYPQTTIISWVYIDPTSSTAQNNLFTVENAIELSWTNNNNGTATIQFAGNPWAWLGNAVVPTGEWIMLTYRHGFTTGDIIYNTITLNSITISGGLAAGTSNYPMLTIMGRTGGPGAPAKGKLARFQIYNRALDDTEIVQNFNAYRGRFGI